MLIFDFLVEKIGYCGREDLFFFGLHRFLVEKQDFVDVKTFFFSFHQFLVKKQVFVDVKTFFFSLHRFLVDSQ